MTLTEEQRGALARAIDYINETDLPVGELDGFDREVLRSMVTTAINYGPDVMKMIELLAAGEHDQWADWAQSILDSEPGLSEGRKAAWPGMIATPYENLSEELKDKDRREVYLRSGDALAEIERLRADLEQAERVIEARLEVIDQQAARIKSLKKEIRRLKHESKVEQELTNSYIKHLHEAEARIKELEDALSEYQRLGKTIAGRVPCLVPHGDCGRCSADPREVCGALEQIAEGKIGSSDHSSDVTKKVWKITDERKAAIGRAIESVVAADSDSEEQESEDVYTWRVLRDMLEEAE